MIFLFFLLYFNLFSIYSKKNIILFMKKEKKKLFPIFTQQKDLIYLDSAGTSLKPDSVIQEIRKYYENYSINSHSEGNNFLANEVRTTIQKTRELIAQKINGKATEIIFLPSTTYALNILALSLKIFLEKGD